MTIAALQVRSETEDLDNLFAMKNERPTPTTCSPSSECDLSSFDKDANGSSGFDDTASIPSMSGDELMSTDFDDEAASLTTPRSSRSRSTSAAGEEEEQFLAVMYPIALLLQLRVACACARSGSACSCNPLGYGSRPESELEPRFRREKDAKDSDKAPSWRSAAPKGGPKGRAGAAGKRASEPQLRRASEPEPKPRLLPTSANSWAAQQQAARSQNDDPSAEDRNIERQARSILNKLTIEKFDRLYEQLASCGVRTEVHVAVIMREVFEKATQQHHFIPMYADLCVKLEHDPRIVPAMETEGTSKGFRGLLLNQCQSAFEGMLAAQDGGAEEQDEEAKALRKHKALGNVKFVGELIVRGMLCTRLLCNIGEDLIQARDACVDALESLAALMTVASPKFDDPQWLHYKRLSHIFARMKELTADRAVPARIRFLLRDVLDMRQAGWPQHGAIQDMKAKPKKLEEVHQEAAQEQAGTLLKRKSNPPSMQGQQARGDRDKEIKEILRRRLVISTSSPTPSKPEQPAEKPAEKPAAEPTTPKEQDKAAPARRSRGGKAARAKKERAANEANEAQRESPTASTAATTPTDSPVMPSRSPSTLPASTPPASAPASPAVEPAAAEPEPMPPALELAPAAAAFDLATFRRELTPLLRKLGRSQAAITEAVESVCAQCVPARYQAKEFADILTRAAEESNGPRRRAALQVAAGLAAAEGPGAFRPAECVSGVRIFLQEVYGDLAEEVTRLDLIVTAEMLPALRKTLCPEELFAVLPEELRSA